jgi:hypothetical protein
LLSTRVTALIGMATSLRPNKCPSCRSTWVTWRLPGVDDQPLNLADGAVGSVDALAAAYRYLTQGQAVVGDGQAVPAQAVVGHGEHLAEGIPRVPRAARQVLGPLGGRELVEFRERAADPDPALGGIGEADRDKPLKAAPLDHQMGDCLGDRIKDDAGQLAAGPVDADSVDPHRERCRPCHGRPPWFLQNQRSLTHPGGEHAAHVLGADVRGTCRLVRRNRETSARR